KIILRSRCSKRLATLRNYRLCICDRQIKFRRILEYCRSLTSSKVQWTFREDETEFGSTRKIEIPTESNKEAFITAMKAHNHGASCRAVLMVDVADRVVRVDSCQ